MGSCSWVSTAEAMGGIMNRNWLFVAIAVAAGPLGAANFTWNGAVNSDWSNAGNWTNGVAPLTATNGTDFIWLLPGGNPPTNQDITGLNIWRLCLTNAISGAICGKPIILRSVYCYDDATVWRTNAINCNIILGPNHESWAVGKSYLWVNGVLGQTNGSRDLAANGIVQNGTTVLAASNTFTGGLKNNQAPIAFLDDYNLGPVPAGYVSNFFANGGARNVISTGGWKRVAIHTNRGWYATGGALVAATNVKLIYNAPITGVGSIALTGGEVLVGGNNATRSGDVQVNGLITLTHSNALGTATGAKITSGLGSLDLNGYNMLHHWPSIWNNTGFDTAGCIRNSNTGRTSTVIGDVGLSLSGNSVAFGGMGDIVVEGCIWGVTNGQLYKAGGGTLTLKGTNTYTGATLVYNGGLTLDYRTYNTSKVATNALNLSQATVRLIGSDAGPTVQSIGNLASLGFSGHAYFRLESGQNQNLTLAVQSLSLTSPYDVTLVNNGTGVAALTATNADTRLWPRATWNRSTWAKLAGGTVTNMAPDEFVSTYTNYAHVNMVAGSITNAGNSYAYTLRSDVPAGATLSVSNGGVFNMNVTSNAGILMTSSSGPITINAQGTGKMWLNGSGPLYIHQYSTNPLTLAAFIDTSNGGDVLTKCGPGEVIVLGTNKYQGAAVYGGTLTIGNISNAATACAIGTDTDLPIANGTLKYTGPAVAHNHRFVLRGPGTIDASGSGVFEFTAASNVVQHGTAGNDNPLTLTGTGAGMMDSVLDLHLGSLTKTGSGTWTIKGTQPYTGNTTVNEGTLCFSNNCVLARSLIVNTSGMIAGNVTVQEDLVMNGTRRVEIRGDADYDTLAVGYDATLNGALTIVPVGGYKLTPNLALSIVTAGGTLSGSITNNVTGGYTVTVSSDGKQLLLSRRLPGFIFSLY